MTGNATDDGLIGHEILGTYQLVEVLGRGGMAVVYRGRHVLTDQDVAIKVLPPELASMPEVKARFIEEARTLGRLEHPNIVTLHNFVEEDGHLFLVMQFARGETFDRVIAREGRVDLSDVVGVGVETLRALEYAHERNVVHRDIKPSNIIIRGDGTVKVMDFGIAKIIGSTKLTQTGQTMGTVRYMSPEQVRGKSIDYRTDLYSLGVALYEGATGRTPFDGETHFEIMRKHLSELPRPPVELVEMPPQLNEVLLQAMAKRAEDRFQTARDFCRALEASPVDESKRRLTRSSVQLTPIGATGAADAMRVRRWPLALAGVVVLAAVATVVWVLLSDGGGGAVERPSADDATTRRVKPRWPRPHRIARAQRFAIDRRFDELQLRVMSLRQVDLAAITALYRRARKRYREFLRDEGLQHVKVTVAPLNLAIVPQTLLNKHFKPKVVKVDGREYERIFPTQYDAPTATLFVHDGKGFMESDLPYGLGLHFSVLIPQLSNERLLELAEGFERFLRQRK